jgi:hypothetical protein
MAGRADQRETGIGRFGTSRTLSPYRTMKPKRTAPLRPANTKLPAASRVRTICGAKRDSHCIHAQTRAGPAYIDISPSTRRFLKRLGPYQSLLVLAVPLAIVEPLKLIALFVVGEGHFIAGVLVMICAYAGSFFVTERLFVLLKPKLLTLRW